LYIGGNKYLIGKFVQKKSHFHPEEIVKFEKREKRRWGYKDSEAEGELFINVGRNVIFRRTLGGKFDREWGDTCVFYCPSTFVGYTPREYCVTQSEKQQRGSKSNKPEREEQQEK